MLNELLICIKSCHVRVYGALPAPSMYLRTNSIWFARMESEIKPFFLPFKFLFQMGLQAVMDKAAMVEGIPATVKQVMVQEGEGMDQVKVLPLLNRT